MKATELIRQLQTLVDAYGDTRVRIWDQSEGRYKNVLHSETYPSVVQTYPSVVQGPLIDLVIE